MQTYVTRCPYYSIFPDAFFLVDKEATIESELILLCKPCFSWLIFAISISRSALSLRFFATRNSILSLRLIVVLDEDASLLMRFFGRFWGSSSSGSINIVALLLLSFFFLEAFLDSWDAMFAVLRALVDIDLERPRKFTGFDCDPSEPM